MLSRNEEIKRIISFIDDIVKEVGKPKVEYRPMLFPMRYGIQFMNGWEDMNGHDERR